MKFKTETPRVLNHYFRFSHSMIILTSSATARTVSVGLRDLVSASRVWGPVLYNVLLWSAVLFIILATMPAT